MKRDPLFGTDRVRTVHVLPRHISAIPIFPDAAGRVQLGTIVRLPAEAELEVCGEGFDIRTIKVLWGGHSYYVFADDVEQSNPHLANMAAAG